MNKRNEAGFSEQAPMEQVRDLLFGTQLKEMEIRVQRQEELFQREITDAKDALRARIESLENFMKSEISSLLHRLKEEQDERSTLLKTETKERQDAIKTEQRDRNEALKMELRERNEAVSQITKDIAALGDSVDRKLAKLSSTLDATEREVRQLLLSESGTLSGKIEEKYQDALDALSKTASQIRHDMVYRTALSSMLTEVVFKLSGKWSPETSSALAAEAPKESFREEPAAPQVAPNKPEQASKS